MGMLGVGEIGIDGIGDMEGMFGMEGMFSIGIFMPFMSFIIFFHVRFHGLTTAFAVGFHGATPARLRDEQVQAGDDDEDSGCDTCDGEGSVEPASPSWAGGGRGGGGGVGHRLHTFLGLPGPNDAYRDPPALYP